MTQSDYDNPPDPPFTCLRCRDIIDEDDSERYAGLCEGCYEWVIDCAGTFQRHIIKDLEQRLKEAKSATGARE